MENKGQIACASCGTVTTREETHGYVRMEQGPVSITFAVVGDPAETRKQFDVAVDASRGVLDVMQQQYDAANS